jgi:hypothetical protein
MSQSSALKTEICFSETLAIAYESARHQNPEEEEEEQQQQQCNNINNTVVTV